MDTLDTPNQTSAAAELNELRASCDSLRQLLNVVLVLCLIISATLNVYLLRQFKYSRLDLAGVKPQVTQLVAEYNKTSAPAIKEFVSKLAEFGHSHPDFAPVLAKYGINAGGAAAVPGLKGAAPTLPPAKK